ncbi:Apolipoprotein L3 [Manis javanica]|nr:apolipoprotein L3 [Manis javanica]KAI5942863.1 Apolipoprotein L3 [Manis javanica]
MTSEHKRFLEEVTEYFRSTVSRQELNLLLTNRKTWERFVAEAGLSSYEAGILHEALGKLKTDMAMQDTDMPLETCLKRKEFLEALHRLKLYQDVYIRELYALADKVDKVHRDCTIANVVTASTGTVSGILSIVALALAPVTAGVSVVLLGTGIGLGIATTITGVSTSIVDYVSESSAKAKARCLVPTHVDLEKAIHQDLILLKEIYIQGLKCIMHHAIKLAKASCTAPAKSVMTTARIPFQSSGPVKTALGGAALTVSRGAQIAGITTSAISILCNLVNLVKESKHLHEGAKTQLAKELRQQAWKLERELQELMGIYESLSTGGPDS